ncbi:ubiquitin carboxy terminal hydrolase Ubp2 [Schizosaccharomyces cryophilus OY26]|uniref:ubiquitinyl hydrolase 1 n=1 Tax=Schizosaccharomyces cryophilus (strain OY26 / ATCC MYA-4695 / CBS 11777 / NBRC 106824 / NRRL Y48691) TaxID=653667 RepID=S9XGD7_SCHCR|nr:ubiquitin carboxy terminal hydrolase Ubp2 [Schizosaccharomyces cryophilus OY26]EPY52736.1 ubiquitin carboxy terminal hydrolase Ubp2 [Schizosaccharomyces cryophilus OY26]
MADMQGLKIRKSPNRLIQDLDVFDGSSKDWNNPWSSHNAKYHWQLHFASVDSVEQNPYDFWCVCQKTRKHMHVQIQKENGFPLIKEPGVDFTPPEKIIAFCMMEETELLNEHVENTPNSSVCSAVQWKSEDGKISVKVEWRDSYLDASCIKDIIDSRRPSFASLIAKKSASQQQSPRSSHPSLYTTFASLELFLRNVLFNNDHRTISAAPEGTFEKHVGKGPHIKKLMNLLSFHFNSENVNFVPSIANEPLTNEQKINLTLARNELIILANNYRDGLKDPLVPSPNASAKLARPYLISALHVPAYNSVAPMYTSIFHQNSASLPDDPAFIALGVTNDYPDDLVCFFYNKQKENDPDNARIYVDALAHIYNLRKTAALKDQLQSDRNIGLVSSDTIQAAYSSLSLVTEVSALAHNFKYTDEDILNTFLKFIEKHPESIRVQRENLETIAYARNSKGLLEYLRSTHRIFYSIDEACTWLGITPDTEDGMVASVALVKFEDDSLKAIEAVKCIAEERNSSVLYEFLASQDPSYIPQIPDSFMTTDDAYETLAVQDRDVSDDMLINVYNFAVEDQPELSDRLKSALNCIGKSRNSKLIMHFLEHGNLDVPEEPPNLNVPVGLENTGNFCYLNSLLQYYFIIKPLRDAVLGIDHNKDISMVKDRGAVKKVGGRSVNRIEFLRALQFTYELRSLFQQLITTKSSSILPSSKLAYLALIPLTMEQVNSTSSSVIHPMELSNASLESHQHTQQTAAPSNSSRSTSASDLVNLPSNNEQDTQIAYFDISEEEINSSLDLGRQQDVAECIDHVLFQIEVSLGPTKDNEGSKNSDEDLIRRLFYGKTKQTLHDDSQGTRSSEELYSHLIVDLYTERQTLYDVLDGVFETVTLDLGNETTKRSLCIKELPMILQLQIQRVQFDRSTGQPFKSNAYVEFGRELHMDRYMEDENGQMAPLLDEYWNMKQRIGELQQRQKFLMTTNSQLLSSVDTLTTLSAWADDQKRSRLPISKKLPQLLQEETEKIKVELKAMKQEEIRLQEERMHLFDGHMKHSYDLLAVFIHRGQATFGHYWTYMRDFNTNVFRKYNDEYITEVDENEVFADTTGNTANPYMLTYVRKDCRHLIECLSRNPDLSCEN